MLGPEMEILLLPGGESSGDSEGRRLYTSWDVAYRGVKGGCGVCVMGEESDVLSLRMGGVVTHLWLDESGNSARDNLVGAEVGGAFPLGEKFGASFTLALLRETSKSEWRWEVAAGIAF